MKTSMTTDRTSAGPPAGGHEDFGTKPDEVGLASRRRCAWDGRPTKYVQLAFLVIVFLTTLGITYTLMHAVDTVAGQKW